MNRVQTSQKVATTLRTAANEVEHHGPLGKIDWAALFAMFIELLPIIIALFSKPNEEKPSA